MKKIILATLIASTLMLADENVLIVSELDKTDNIVKIDPLQEIDDRDLYIGLGISAMSSRLSSVSMDIFNDIYGQDRLGNINLQAGYIINDYIAVEGRYGFTVADDDQVEMRNEWSLFLKPMYKFEDSYDRTNGEDYFAVYALLGYGSVEFTGVNGVNALVEDSNFRWGLGFSYTFREYSEYDEYKFKDTWTVYFDYVNVGKDMYGLYYMGEDYIDADSFTTGLLYKF
jgi:hypothetical protein